MGYDPNNPLDQSGFQPGFTGPAPSGGSPNDPNGTGMYRDPETGLYWDPQTGWVSKANENKAIEENGEEIARGLKKRRVVDPAADAARYDEMSKAKYTSGPQIDMTRPDESRGMAMGGLAMLQQRAQGAVTPAQQQLQQQTQGAVAGLQSGAASVKGGAAARAAAGRGAQATGDRVSAQGTQDTAALRAREMADASSQYFGASAGQRGRDLGVATAQADLDAKQRTANEARDQFYQGLEYDEKAAAVGDKLGRDDAAANAANASRTAGMAEDASRAGRMKDVANAGVGAVNGGIGAANNASNGGPPQKSDDPWDPKNYSGSDERMKHNVSKVTDAEAKRLKARGDAMIANTAALSGGAKRPVSDAEARDLQRRGDAMIAQTEARSGKTKRPVSDAEARDLKQRGEAMFGQTQADAAAPPSIGKAPRAQTLDEAMAASVEGADPYKKPTPATGVAGAPRGYAASRNGQMGSMFGTTERPSYDLGQGYNTERDGVMSAKTYTSKPSARPENEWAPGSSDLYAGSHSRDLVTSDPAAKRQAFIDGANHSLNMDSKDKPELPDYMGQGTRHEDDEDATQRARDTLRRVSRSNPSSKAGDEARMADEITTQRAQDTLARANAGSPSSKAAQQEMSGPRGVVASTRSTGGKAGVNSFYNYSRPDEQAAPDEQAMGGEPPDGGIRGAVSDAWQGIQTRLRDMSPSDEKTKKNVSHFGGPMAAANRSMDASSYEYRPEYTPEEQEPGEKNVGPMANAMKRDPVASTAIVTNPDTGLLAIDKTKALKLTMGGLSALQRQVDKLQSQRMAK